MKFTVREHGPRTGSLTRFCVVPRRCLACKRIVVLEKMHCCFIDFLLHKRCDKDVGCFIDFLLHGRCDKDVGMCAFLCHDCCPSRTSAYFFFKFTQNTIRQLTWQDLWRESDRKMTFIHASWTEWKKLQ